MNFSELEEAIKRQAYRNILRALDAESTKIGGMDNSVVVGNAIATLDFLRGGDGSPTCPYLDSLEDEDEFCECGAAEEPYAKGGGYDPLIGTYVIYCKN